MNERLLADLDAFGRGDLAREDLTASHGGDAISLLAMHDRMLAVAAVTPALDADAGWAALSAQLDAVVVPFVPRRGVRRRTMAIAMAAALLLGGSAFAATRAGWFDDPVVPTPPAETALSDSTPSGSGLGAPGAASADRMGTRPPERETRDPSDTDDDPSGAPGDADDPNGSTGGTGRDTGDDPNDRDQGTGNDGDHDDQGGGNDGQEGDQGRGQGPDDPGGGVQGRPTEPPGA